MIRKFYDSEFISSGRRLPLIRVGERVKVLKAGTTDTAMTGKVYPIINIYNNEIHLAGAKGGGWSIDDEGVRWERVHGPIKVTFKLPKHGENTQ